jgi:hypothetical protein
MSQAQFTMEAPPRGSWQTSRALHLGRAFLSLMLTYRDRLEVERSRQRAIGRGL